MTELIKALTEMARAITAHYEKKDNPMLPFREQDAVGAQATATEDALKKQRKPRTPKTVEVPATATVEKKDDGLGLDDTTAIPQKKELTEKESQARMEEVTKQFVSLCKNDKPEDGKTRAIKLMQTVFKVGKLGDLTHDMRLKWIAEMEKGIAEHK